MLGEDVTKITTTDQIDKFLNVYCKHSGLIDYVISGLRAKWNDLSYVQQYDVMRENFRFVSPLVLNDVDLNDIIFERWEYYYK